MKRIAKIKDYFSPNKRIARLLDKAAKIAQKAGFTRSYENYTKQAEDFRKWWDK